MIYLFAFLSGFNGFPRFHTWFRPWFQPVLAVFSTPKLKAPPAIRLFSWNFLTFQVLFGLECVKILFLFMKTCVYKCYTFVTCQNWTELSR